MATITSTSERITVSGTYKAFTGGSGNTTTVIQFSSGDAPATGDAGRFLLWKNGANTGDWEVRFIESATASTVTVTDGGFSSAPGAGEDFVISTSLADIDGATDESVMRSQGNSYQMRDRDFELASGAFLADVNASLSTKSTQTGSGFITTYPVANGCVLQFGRLIGGEANDSTETIGGCQIIFEVSNDTLIFTDQGSANTAGPVLNFYGCLIESVGNGFGPFIRSPGAMRIIGCVADGPMGGRLYSANSELVDTRFSGNLSGGVAWSLGGSFTRPIANAFFFQGNTAVKAFSSASGAFSNTTFASSLTNIIDAGSASAGLLFSFIDCTTFADGDITASKGQYEQLKSINYTVTDASGTGLSGVKVAVYDTVGDVQGGGVQTSSSGAVPQINARFFRKDHGATAVIKAPFDIRIRKYGYVYQGFQSSVGEPIKQEVRLVDNLNVVSTEAQAAAITGIALNFATSTATITSDHNTQNLYDYYQYQLGQTASMVYSEDLILSGTVFDMADWDVIIDDCTFTGNITTTGTVTLLNGATVTGTITDANGITVKITSNTAEFGFYGEIDGIPVGTYEFDLTSKSVQLQDGQTLRFMVGAHGYKTKYLELTTTTLDNARVVLDRDGAIDISLPQATKDSVIALLGVEVEGSGLTAQIAITVSGDGKGFTSTEFLSGFDLFLYENSQAIAPFIVLAQTADLYNFFEGGVTNFAPNFYARLDNSITTQIDRGYYVPLVFEDGAPGVVSIRPNTSGLLLGAALWTKSTALISTLDVLRIQDPLAKETTASSIKAKTDNLPADPAGVSDLPDVSGIATTTQLTVVNEGVKKASLGIPHSTDL